MDPPFFHWQFGLYLKDGTEKPILALQNIYKGLAQNPNYKSVDVLANYKSRFEVRSKLPTIERTIAQKGMVLYGRNFQRSKAVWVLWNREKKLASQQEHGFLQWVVLKLWQSILQTFTFSFLGYCAFGIMYDIKKQWQKI